MKLGSFCRSSFAKVIPMVLKGMRIEFSDLTEGKLQTLNWLVRLTRGQKRFRQDGLKDVEFAH
jgi:hypothetical protein